MANRGQIANFAKIRRNSIPGPALQAHWRETTVGEQGELVLEDLPFEPGQPVEVLVVSKTARLTTAGGQSLRDSVLERSLTPIWCRWFSREIAGRLPRNLN
jgi:hypothetical protein